MTKTPPKRHYVTWERHNGGYTMRQVGYVSDTKLIEMLAERIKKRRAQGLLKTGEFQSRWRRDNLPGMLYELKQELGDKWLYGRDFHRIMRKAMTKAGQPNRRKKSHKRKHSGKNEVRPLPL